MTKYSTFADKTLISGEVVQHEEKNMSAAEFRKYIKSIEKVISNLNELQSNTYLPRLRVPNSHCNFLIF